MPMEAFEKQDITGAIKAVESMIARSEKAQEKFAQGTSQHTLQKNRINALYIALALIKREAGENNAAESFANGELEAAVAPIVSLKAKSEKAQTKLAPGSWQHTMLESNIKALRIALPLLEKELDEARE